MPSRSLVRFIARRLVALVFLSIGITFVAFVLTHLVPGDPVRANLGQAAQFDPKAIEAFRQQYGLDKPLPVQYGLYLENLLRGNLGVSQQTHNPVTRDLGHAIPATAELAIASMAIALVLGVGFGVLSAVRRNRLADHVIRFISLAGVSVPAFWLALLCLYAFFFRLPWFPGGGRLDPGVVAPPSTTGLYSVDAVIHGQWASLWNALHHLVLPALVLALTNVGLLTRYTRSAMLEVLGEDYVQAARAKGLPERTVILRHALRAAMPSLVTVIGLAFANVMTGSVLVEQIFSWPGLGQYAFQSANALDLQAIMGVSLFVAVVYISINFVVDILYGVIDPRIRVT